MLWRSSYWDSAGWQVTVLAVRVFGPLSLPQTSCPLWEPAPRSSLQSNRGLPLSRLECTLCMCIGLCVFVCSKKNGLSHLAQVMCHAFVLISYFVLHQKRFILSSASLFYFTAFIFSTFCISFLGFIPTTCWAEIRISHQGLWICHTPTLVYLQRQSEIIFVTSVMKKSPHTKPQTKKWQYSIQTALSIKERNIKAKDTSLICAKRTSANKK